MCNVLVASPMESHAASTKQRRLYPGSALSLISSYDIFMSFVEKQEDGKVTCTKILSSKCYKKWLKTRLQEPRKPPESFRRAITAHCRGEDGRRPFPPGVEAALLKQMRKKKIWSCFRKTDVKIGARGYQAIGYWEKKKIMKETAEGSSKLLKAGRLEKKEIEKESVNRAKGLFSQANIQETLRIIDQHTEKASSKRKREESKPCLNDKKRFFEPNHRMNHVNKKNRIIETKAVQGLVKHQVDTRNMNGNVKEEVNLMPPSTDRIEIPTSSVYEDHLYCDGVSSSSSNYTFASAPNKRPDYANCDRLNAGLLNHAVEISEWDHDYIHLEDPFIPHKHQLAIPPVFSPRKHPWIDDTLDLFCAEPFISGQQSPRNKDHE